MRRRVVVGAVAALVVAMVPVAVVSAAAAPASVACSIDAGTLTCPLPAPPTVTQTVTVTAQPATSAVTSSAPASTAPATTTSAPVSTTPTSPPAGTAPLGVPGSWRSVFTDDFNGSAIDASRWNLNEGKKQNGVTNRAANVTVTNGEAVLTLPSASSGAMLSSGKVDGVGSDRYLLPVGSFAEARVFFPGSGTTVSNWPAWWAVGNGWPTNGENDIAEGLGRMTVNYHSPTKNFGYTIPGTWAGAFHVYGIHRKTASTDIYYDGVLVKSWATADTGIGQALVLNLGHGYGPAVFGAASQVRVDYVRAWATQ